MALIDSRPLTPGQRYLTRNKQDVSKKKSERGLTVVKHNKKGRNAYGRITSRRRGGGHKRKYRIIDFRRDKLDIPATVKAIEYDPNRSANIALLAYADGEKRYILAPRGMIRPNELPSGWGLLECASRWATFRRSTLAELAETPLTLARVAPDANPRPAHRARLLRNIAVASTAAAFRKEAMVAPPRARSTAQPRAAAG